MNEYEKAFVEHMSKSGIRGPEFARLTKEAYESEFGGEGDVLLKELSQETLEDPQRFATEVYKTYGMGALQYYSMIVRYADSGRFNPEEEAEEEAEEADLQTIVDEVDSNSEQEPESGPTA